MDNTVEEGWEMRFSFLTSDVGWSLAEDKEKGGLGEEGESRSMFQRRWTGGSQDAWI